MQPKIRLIYIHDIPGLNIPLEFFTENNLLCEIHRQKNLPHPDLDPQDITSDIIVICTYTTDDQLLTWLNESKVSFATNPVVILARQSTVTDAVACLKHGAFDFIDVSEGWNESVRNQLLLALKKAGDKVKVINEPTPDMVTQFYQIFEIAPLGYQSLDEQGNFLYVNEEWTKTLGYTKDEVIGKSFGSVMPPDEAAYFPTRFNGFKNAGKVSADIRIIDKWGNERIARFNGRIGYKANGEFDRTHCILLDLTERVKLEDQLRESEEKYRLLLDTSIDAVMLTHPDGRIFSANRAACKMLDMTEEEILEGGRGLVIDTEDPRLPGYLKQRQETGRVSGVLTFIRKDKTRFQGEFTSAIFKTSQGNIMSSVVIRDISERLKTLRQISESENKYRMLIENQSDQIVSFDGKGNILYTSPSFQKFTGIPEGECEGRSFFSFLPEEEKANPEAILKEISRHPHNHYMELRMQSPGGPQWIAWNNNATLDEQGNIHEVICIGRNIHEQKMAQMTIQEQLQELKRWHDTTLGREFRILELKKEVNQLLMESGKPPRYESAT